MAASKIDVVFLHCDQGMGTLVKIYDSKDRLASLALLDLGSEAGTKKYSDKALETVIRALNQMKSDKMTPMIDLLLVSHQDTDHWSLLPDLLARIEEQFIDFGIKEIYYGGLGWKKGASEAIEEWEEAYGVPAEPFGKEQSDFSKPGKLNDFTQIDDVKFHLMCVNVPISRSAGDLKRNGTSAVIAIQFAGIFVVIPGDATADTCGWMNTNLFAAWKKKGQGNPVQPCRAMGAPHHGALRTIASNYVSTDKAKLEVATTFANNVAAEHVVASAGWYSKFKHPYKSVLLLLAVKAKDTSKHDLVWYDGTKADWDHVKNYKRGVYTTITTLTDPPKRTGWMFTISATGEIAFFIDWEQAEIIPPYERHDRYPAVPHNE